MFEVSDRVRHKILIKKVLSCKIVASIIIQFTFIFKVKTCSLRVKLIASLLHFVIWEYLRPCYFIFSMITAFSSCSLLYSSSSDSNDAWSLSIVNRSWRKPQEYICILDQIINRDQHLQHCLSEPSRGQPSSSFLSAEWASVILQQHPFHYLHATVTPPEWWATEMTIPCAQSFRTRFISSGNGIHKCSRSW